MDTVENFKLDRKRKVFVLANLGLGDKFVDHALLYYGALKAVFNPVTLVDIQSLLISPLDPRFGGSVVVFLDKDIALAEALRSTGALVVNTPEAISVCDDKRLTYLALTRAGVPIPQTLLLPPLYPKQRLDPETLSSITTELGLPLVIKEAKGSFGAQVYLVQSEEDLEVLTYQLGDRRLVAQKYVSTSFGTDIRIQVVNGEIVAAISRHNENDFRANLSNGGTGRPYQPTSFEQELAIESAAAVGGFNVGVDLLLGPSGKGEMVCEVNSNAHIRRLSSITGVDVASRFAILLLHYLEELD
jgi:RimK family alpha-L-glutamate ligase